MRADESEWEEAEVAEQYRLASPVIQRLQRLLASRPGEAVSAEEAAAELGVARNVFAGALGAYSGLVYRRWGRYAWPFNVERDRRGSRVSYAMPEDVALVIGRQPEPLDS